MVEFYTSSITKVNNDVQITLQFSPNVPVEKLAYIAPAPADYRASFSGSGLPFPNREQAFDDTPNNGVVAVNGGSVVLHLHMPNAYYDDFKGTLVLPHVLCMAMYNDQKKDFVIELGNKIPYRALTYHNGRRNAEFYNKGWSMPVRTQESVLRDSGYPATNAEAPDFWGLRPPL